MATVFVGLVIASGVAAIVGFVWSVALDLQARKTAESASEETQRREPGETDQDVTHAEADGIPTGRDRSPADLGFSFAGVGRRLRVDGLRDSIPWLLVAGGLLCLLIFGALALFASLPSKVFGIAAVAIAVYVGVTEMRAFGKALKG